MTPVCVNEPRKNDFTHLTEVLQKSADIIGIRFSLPFQDVCTTPKHCVSRIFKKLDMCLQSYSV